MSYTKPLDPYQPKTERYLAQLRLSSLVYPSPLLNWADLPLGLEMIRVAIYPALRESIASHWLSGEFSQRHYLLWPHTDPAGILRGKNTVLRHIYTEPNPTPDLIIQGIVDSVNRINHLAIFLICGNSDGRLSKPFRVATQIEPSLIGNIKVGQSLQARGHLSPSNHLVVTQIKPIVLPEVTL